MFRNIVNQIPSNARQCDGPLLYSMDHWIAPNGDFFSVSPKTGKITQLKPSGPKCQYYSFGGAMHLLDNEETQPMEAIEGIFVRNKGSIRVLIRALVCYYFVKKIDNLIGLRADWINPQDPISPENLHWVSKNGQVIRRMGDLRSKARTVISNITIIIPFLSLSDK